MDVNNALLLLMMKNPNKPWRNIWTPWGEILRIYARSYVRPPLIRRYPRLPPVFLETYLLVFSEILHNDWNLEKSARRGFSGFSRKIHIWPKMGPKWSLHKILSLLFAGNNLLMKDVTILSPSVAPYLGKLWLTNYI